MGAYAGVRLFRCAKSLQKIAKKFDLPLDIYGSICYNNSVRRGGTK
nr:MAG TPA: hypothetical protein [Caudoviricetes sp.]